MTTAELVRVPEPMLPMNIDQAAQAMRAYQELTGKLLTAEDWQGIPGRDQSFVKRRGWAKLANFYSVSTELRTVNLDRDDDGSLLRARCIARATHPNGRYAEGDGACAITERRFANAGGRQKVEHDLPATAATRATNRAISNLIGFGEVSAEEATEVETIAPSEWGELAPEQLKIEAAVAVQQLHPGIDGYQFMDLLARRFKLPGVPKAAVYALKGLQWVIAEGETTGNESENVPEGAPEPASEPESAPPDPSVSTYHQPPPSAPPEEEPDQ